MSTLRGLFAQLPDETRKRAVWTKGHLVDGYDPAVLRRDDYGHLILYSDYGDRNSDYGWEMDHIVPRGLGLLGSALSDDISNMRPLHCRRNASLGGTLGGALKG